MEQQKDLSTFELNPSNWLGLLGAVLILLVSFGVNITGDQVTAITKVAEAGMLAVVPIFTAWLTRRKVIPVAKVEAQVGSIVADKIAHTTTKPVVAIFLVLSLGGGALLEIGCAKNRPDLTPEGTLAARATQVTEGLRATLPGLKGLTCRTLEEQKAEKRLCLTPNETEFALAQMDVAFKQAQNLSRVLKEVNEARTEAERTEGMGRAAAIAQGIQEAIQAIVIRPAFEEARQSVWKLVSGVTSLLLAFTPITPLPSPPGLLLELAL